MFPGKPRNLEKSPMTRSGRFLSEEKVILRKRTNMRNFVPSARNMEEPRLPTILGIVGSRRKMDLSKKGSRNPTVSQIRSQTVIHLRLFWTVLIKSKVSWIKKKRERDDLSDSSNNS